MGKLTEWFDYINREPNKFGKDFTRFHYLHFTVTPTAKATRRKYRYEERKDNHARP